MAVEPLSSVMTYQAQPLAAPKPVAPVAEKPETTENSTVQTTEKVDNTTVTVENAQEKGKGNNNAPEYQNQQQQQQQQTASTKQLREAIEQMRKNMSNSEAIFGIHDKTNRVTIKIVDKQTKEVIKELPPEKTLDMIAKAWELAGLLVDERR